MQAVDLELLNRSAKFVFTDGIPDNPRKWIIRTLKTVIDPQDITAIFRCDIGGAWFSTFTSEEVAEQVIASDYSSLDSKVKVSRADKRTVQLKVLWLPVWIKLIAVEMFLEQFGTVISCVRETEASEGVSFSNGNIKVALEVSEKEVHSIPYRAVIGGKDCLLTVFGRPPKCLKCKEVGHIRRNCPSVKKSTVPIPSQKVLVSETQNIDNSTSETLDSQVTTPDTQESTEDTMETEKSPSVSKSWSDIVTEAEDLSTSGKKRKMDKVKKLTYELCFVKMSDGKVKPSLGCLNDKNQLTTSKMSDKELEGIIGKEPDRQKHKQLLLDNLQDDIDIVVDPYYFSHKSK
ncbi:uncharacterized protein LOC134697110 [Mytilus trossulus]|uniref:uncharacterized protein LOC134697110 n=1 Tax=Mytilus trossulus TaxID=6551 RepID=UPI0030062E75